MTEPKQKRWAPIAIVGAVFGLYAMTASRWLAQADSPEFAALLETGGAAHPPGYPTVVLWYRAFSWLPLEAQWGAALVTALVGTASVAALYRAAIAWGATSRGALGAAILVGLNTQVWLVHTHPEAFAFNNLFAAAIVWFSAPAAPLRGTGRIAVLGLLAGVGLGAHHSIVFLAPVGLWGVLAGVRESERVVPALLAGAGTLVVGLSVYGYLLIAPEATSFGRIDGWDALLHHFLRSDYGTAQLGAVGTLAPFRQLVFWVTETIADAALVGMLVFALGVARVFAPEDQGGARRRSPWLCLLGAWLLAGPVFVMMFNRPPEGLTVEVVKRFHVLPVVVGAPFVAIGVERIFELDIARQWRVAIGLAVAGLLVGAGLVRTTRVYDATIEDYVSNTLRSVPRNAVVIGQGDHRYFGFQYLQEVEGLRRDVVFIEPIVLGFDWYVDRMRARLGVQLPYASEHAEGGRKVELRETLDTLLDGTERDVFVTRDFAEQILSEYPMEPWGAGWRLLREGEDARAPTELAEHNAEIYAEFTHRTDAPVYGHNRWGWSLWNTYTRVWEDVRERCGEDLACRAIAERHLQRYPDL
jgi:hypothetical protein